MDIVDQLPKHPTLRYETRDLEAIDTLVLHHTATGPEVTPDEIAAYHTSWNQWPGISYHYVLTSDGTLYQTQRLETMSYHVASRNRTSVGLCVVGDFTKGEPTEAQKAALDEAVSYVWDKIQEANGDRDVEIWDHAGYALPQYATSCPGRLMEWI